MEIQTGMECRIKVLASMDNTGVVSGKLVGHMPYASEKEMPKPKVEEIDGAAVVKPVLLPEVSAEIVLTADDHKAIKAVFDAIVAREAEALALKMSDARADARRVARQMGELI
jgi:hypothetical protein